MNKKTKQKLKEIEGEITACFNGWDGAIKNKAQPVTIQDLDYWATELKKIIQEEVTE